MNDDVFEKLNDFYHKKTFDKNWELDCGNGNKKLDEIQAFFKFLKNGNIEIESVDSFDKNFKYKERDVDEPGDLEYLGQVYQVTHGNLLNYTTSQKNKNDRIKKKLLEAFIVPAKDIALPDKDRYKYYIQDLSEKEKSAKSNVILLVLINRRKCLALDYKVKTNWQNIMFVFDDGNISAKN